MTSIVGVRFKTAGKISYYTPGKLEISKGDHVIVETARGVEYGTVVIGPVNTDNEQDYMPIKQVMRIATAEDDAKQEMNRLKEREAFQICLEKIQKHKLDMKLIECEYTFDNNKVLFYFTADGRIDFRELVKDLAAVFRTRIELRQIGSRDEAKLLGGIASCGRPLCCNSYLVDFAPVSIKMAKEQGLSLNPTKISGVCGRLMCCLKNEEDFYEEVNMGMPEIGDIVTTKEGLKGEVKSISVLKELVRVIVTLENDEKEARDYRASELKFKPKKKQDIFPTDEELKDLEFLEKE